AVADGGHSITVGQPVLAAHGSALGRKTEPRRFLAQVPHAQRKIEKLPITKPGRGFVRPKKVRRPGSAPAKFAHWPRRCANSAVQAHRASIDAFSKFELPKEQRCP